MQTPRFIVGAGAVAACALAFGCSSPDDSGTTAGGGSGGSPPAGGSGGSPATGGSGGTTSGGSGPGAGAGGNGGSLAGGGGASASGASGVAGSAPGGMGGAAPGGAGGVAPGGTGGGAGQAGGAGSGATGGSSAGSGGSAGGSSSTGCGKAPPASNRYSMDVDGTMRDYILRVPDNYDQNQPYRLVFAWHPLGGSAQQTAGNGNGGYYGLVGASAGAAILVSPEGLQQNGSGNRGWWNSGGGDIAFLRAMLDRFKAELCVDETRVFSTGFSFGGMMSFAVGCTGLVRAIAPMAGNPQVSGCTNGAEPVAMMGFHGVNDTVVQISGGRQGRDIFVDRNGCMDQSAPLTPSWCDGVNANNEPCSCVSYAGCTAGYPVIWCEFNAGHTPAPNSAATIWDFFAQF